jgi:uncharacterized protein YqeY
VSKTVAENVENVEKTIYENMKEDYAAARKDRDEAGDVRDKVKVSALNVVLADAEGIAKGRKNAEDRVVTNFDIIKVLKESINTSTANIATWDSQGRDSGPIHREIAILKAYLPAEVDLDEVRAAARDFADDDAVRAKPQAGQGIVINKLKERYGERYDKAWSAIVKDVIGV